MRAAIIAGVLCVLSCSARSEESSGGHTNWLTCEQPAHMFGMALRTYHYRVARLAESRTERGRRVWEAVLSYVQSQPDILRAEVLRRFRHDEPDLVRGVLRDLVDSRLLYASGRGDQIPRGRRAHGRR